MKNPYKKEVQKFIDGVPNGIEMANLGSTFSKHGFDYRYFGKKGFNFAIAPQPLAYDYRILKQYESCINKGAVVVVVVCPFGFAVDYYPNDDSNWKYYFFLNRDEIHGYSTAKEQKVLNAKTPLLMSSPVKLARKVVDKVLRMLGVKPSPEVRHIDPRINGWMCEFDLQNVKDGSQAKKLAEVFENTTSSLRKILELCKEREFRPVIINMPAIKSQRSQFGDEFMDAFYTENVTKANITNAPVIDYFRDERFNDPALYENGVDCMNDNGRAYFAKIFIEDLKKLGMWEG